MWGLYKVADILLKTNLSEFSSQKPCSILLEIHYSFSIQDQFTIIQDW